MCLHYSPCPTDTPAPVPRALPRKRAATAITAGTAAPADDRPAPPAAHPPRPRPVDAWPSPHNTFEEAAQIMMRRTDALREHCADPANYDEATLAGVAIVIRQLARIRERDRSITKHAPDYPGQQDEASEVATCVSKVIQRSGVPPLDPCAAHDAGQATAVLQEGRQRRPVPGHRGVVVLHHGRQAPRCADTVGRPVRTRSHARRSRHQPDQGHPDQLQRLVRALHHGGHRRIRAPPHPRPSRRSSPRRGRTPEPPRPRPPRVHGAHARRTDPRGPQHTTRPGVPVRVLAVHLQTRWSRSHPHVTGRSPAPDPVRPAAARVVPRGVEPHARQTRRPALP